MLSWSVALPLSCGSHWQEEESGSIINLGNVSVIDLGSEQIPHLAHILQRQESTEKNRLLTVFHVFALTTEFPQLGRINVTRQCPSAEGSSSLHTSFSTASGALSATTYVKTEVPASITASSLAVGLIPFSARFNTTFSTTINKSSTAGTTGKQGPAVYIAIEDWVNCSTATIPGKDVCTRI